MFLVQQRLLGREIWLFKSEFTSVDVTALSVVWGFVGFFLFSCSVSADAERVVISNNDCVNALNVIQLNSKKRLNDET